MSVLQLTRPLPGRPADCAVADLVIRTYQGPDDIARWLEVRHRAFAREKLGVREWVAADFEREFLSKPWWRPERMWFADEHATKSAEPPTIGTVTLAMRGDGATAKPVVHWLAVLPGRRRQGIGRLLMATLETAAWDAGYRQVWLETHSAWTDAASLYAALGYRTAE
jgi:GNAT superfamily N-acetyltransferase